MGALFFTADNATNDDSIGDLPNLPVPISYPQYGGFALLPLEGPDYTTRASFWHPLRMLLRALSEKPFWSCHYLKSSLTTMHVLGMLHVTYQMHA